MKASLKFTAAVLVLFAIVVVADRLVVKHKAHPPEKVTTSEAASNEYEVSGNFSSAGAVKK